MPRIARVKDRAPLASHPTYGLPATLRGLWGDRLLLASTETSQAFGGFLEGALQAAADTATRLSPGGRPTPGEPFYSGHTISKAGKATAITNSSNGRPIRQ